MSSPQPTSINAHAEIFEKVLAWPALYVGTCSMIKNGAFMDSYMIAKMEAGEHYENDFYRGFNQWVAKRLKIKSMHNWVGIISFMAQSEDAAYEMTKEMWGEYKTASEKRAKRKEEKT